METAAAELRRVFPADRAAPTAARRAVADMSVDFDAETRFRLELLVTELVSNSVLHASGEVREVGLDVRAGPRQIHVTVIDDGPGFDPDRVQTDGFGLLLLRQLADRWGSDRRPGRSAVWFLLPRKHASGAATAAVSYAGRVAATLLGRGRRTTVDPYLD